MSESRQSDEPLSQQQEQLDRHIASKVEGLLRGLHGQIGERVRSVSDELLRWLEQHAPEVPRSFLGDFDISALAEPSPLPQPATPPSAGELLAAVSRIDSQGSQAEILTSLLEEGCGFASRAGFFLVRQGQVRGWASRGFEEDLAASLQVSATDRPWSAMLEAAATVSVDEESAAALAAQLGGAAPAAAILVPFVIRGQISGALYADRLGDAALDPASLQLLTHSAGQALETLSVSPGRSASLERYGDLPEPASEGPPPEPVAKETATAQPEAVDTDPEPTPELDEVQEPEAAPEPEQDLDPQAVAQPDAEAAPEPEAVPEPEADPEPEAVAPPAPEPEDFVAQPETAPEPEVTPPASSELVADPEAYGSQELSVSDVSLEDDEAPTMAPVSFEPEADPEPAVAAAQETTAAADETARPTEPVPLRSAETEAFSPEETSPSFGVDDGYVPTEDEIALEAEPEPELEDTNIWELEEDEDDDDDDEPTHVGKIVRAAEKAAPAEHREVDSAEPAPALDASIPVGPIGQETVRIDLATIQQHPEAVVPGAPQPAAPQPAAPQPAAPQPAAPQPAAPQPVAPQPAAPQPVAPQPAAPQPVAPQPAAPQPVAPQPTTSEPATSEPATSEPAVAETAPESDSGDDTSPTIHAVPGSGGFAGPSAEPTPAPSSFVDPPKPVAPPPASFATPPSAEVEPPKPEPASGGTQVAPPPDLDGPGLAFATPESPSTEAQSGDGDAALHEEARRLARLLVSEIKLYNEEIIEEGRRTGNIYERLKDDIDRSRQMYEERIDPRLADQEDYFYQELVQRLAGGDRNVLGM